MITQEELESIFVKGLGKDRGLVIARDIITGVYEVDDLLKACLNNNHTVAMKCSWVLHAAQQLQTDLLEGKVKNCIEILEDSPVSGVRREALKMIIALYPWSKAVEKELVELCSFLLESDETATAEKYFSMKIMVKLRDDFPSAFGSYCEILRSVLHDETDAFAHQARKFLNRHSYSE